jgi:hypothetical protein
MSTTQYPDIKFEIKGKIGIITVTSLTLPQRRREI